jgi:hypothetical protein
MLGLAAPTLAPGQDGNSPRDGGNPGQGGGNPGQGGGSSGQEVRKPAPDDSKAGQTAPGAPAAEAESSPPPPPPQGNVEVDTLAGRDSFAAALAAKLAMAPPGGARPTELVLPEGKKIALADVLSIRFPWPEGRPASSKVEDQETTFRLFLRPGDEVAGVVSGGDGDRILLANAALRAEPLAASLAAVRGLLVIAVDGAAGAGGRWGGGDAGMDRLRQRIIVSEEHEDRFILRAGEDVSGILEEVNARGVRLSSDKLSSVSVTYDKLRAFILAPIAEPEQKAGGNDTREAGAAKDEAAGAGGEAGVRVRLVLRDGSILLGSAGALAGGQVTLRHETFGDLSIALGEVSEVSFLNGRARYLSDLEPVRTREEQALLFRQGPNPLRYRRDANVFGGPLRVGNRLYPKGLGVHSYSLLEYDLGGECRRFQATIGLDAIAQPPEPEAAAGHAGAVVFRVRLDGKLLLEKPLTWRQEPVPVDLDVAGGKTLSLEVDYGGPPGSLNPALGRADWADARVIR